MRPVLLIVDNYDSFTFNLVQQCLRLCSSEVEVVVKRNDDAGGLELEPAAIIISPGPGGPSDAGLSKLIVERRGDAPLLGVCLGHQVIASCFGAEVRRAREPVHGKVSPVEHGGARLFLGVPNPALFARYHSLAVEEASLPPEIRPSARARDGTLMALEHVSKPIYGVQFHPESFLSEHGDLILGNFLAEARLC